MEIASTQSARSRGYILVKVEQDRFAAQVECEKREALRVPKLHHATNQRTMLTNFGREEFASPTIRDCIVDLEAGVAAFVTSEQIDYDPCFPGPNGEPNRQMRYKLYFIRHTKGMAVEIFEDHGYELTDGNKEISIDEVTQEKVVFTTANGQQIVKP